MYVLGTAGHVDHGKSTLVQALTGIDPDRLAEEKTRGMTIDLGFAWLKLPGGTEVSIVDVPGHERFIKNMLAGVGGIDLALLVIAADEGVMPQTREHLAILDLLGVSRGIVVLTKSDLVDTDWLDLVQADVEDVIAPTTLSGAPVVRCSAASGDGLQDLFSTIESQLQDLPPKRDLGRPRLPIDRVFTIAGFGTVVTGTLIDGTFKIGQEVEVVPAYVGGHLTVLKSRIRGLQTHRSSVEVAQPGTRTAANLGGLSPDELSRGKVVTTPGWLKPSLAVDVRLRALESLSRPLRHNLNVTFHAYSSETPARLRLLDSDEALPGDEVWAQLRLSRPAAVLRGDRFVIRDANDTLGGGVIVETQAKRHPRKRPGVIAGLERLQSGSPEDTLYSAIAAAEPVEMRVALQRTDLSQEQAEAGFQGLMAEGRITLLGAGGGAKAIEAPPSGALAYTREGFDRIAASAVEHVASFIKTHPLRRGLAKEELRSRLGLQQRVFGLVLDNLLASGVLVDAGASVATPGWSPSLSPAQSRAAEAYVALLGTSPTTPPSDQRLDEELLAHLVEQGQIIDVGSNTVFAMDAYRKMVEQVVGYLRDHGTITMGQARDLLGSSRRYVQPFLEHLDGERITLRRGDERVLGPRAPV